MVACAIGLLAAAAFWFVGCEYYRGRPKTSSRVNFIMTFVSPLGAIALAVAGLICLMHR